MSKISDFILDEWNPQGAATGRIQTKAPNVAPINSSRGKESLWLECRRVHISNYQICDGCVDRFKCWTTSELPEILDWRHIPTPTYLEVDFQQFERRVTEATVALISLRVALEIARLGNEDALVGEKE